MPPFPILRSIKEAVAPLKEEEEDVPLATEGDDEVEVENTEDPEERPSKKRKERRWIEEPFLPLTPEMQDILAISYEVKLLIKRGIDGVQNKRRRGTQ